MSPKDGTLERARHAPWVAGQGNLPGGVSLSLWGNARVYRVTADSDRNILMVSFADRLRRSGAFWASPPRLEDQTAWTPERARTLRA
jgi:hypothetical protein